MKTILALLFLVLSGCSPGSSSGDKATSAAADGIIGGVPVQSSDPIAQATAFVIRGPATLTPDGKTLWQPVSTCSAVLIAPRLLLTAAHCLPTAIGRDLKKEPEAFLIVFLTEIDLRDSFQALLLQGTTGHSPLRAATGFRLDPKYDRSPSEPNQGKPRHDIAVVEINEAAPTGSQPVELLRRIDTLKRGTVVISAGFGPTKRDLANGAYKLRQVPARVAGLDPHAREMDYLTRKGHGTIGGDSGGPTFLSVDGHLLLAGIHAMTSARDDGTLNSDELIPLDLEFINQSIELFTSARKSPRE